LMSWLCHTQQQAKLGSPSVSNPSCRVKRSSQVWGYRNKAEKISYLLL
jgi:hypothetical protein